MSVKPYVLNLSAEDYARFKASHHTRLYAHHRTSDGDVTIWTMFPYDLADDLEKVIDFGATSAVDVLGLSPHISQFRNRIRRSV